MNKICTDIEQSCRLLELGLDPNSSDMYYTPYPNDEYWYDIPNVGMATKEVNQLSAWSLTALLNIAPKYFSKENHQFVQSYSYDHIDGCYHFIYRDYQHGGRSKYISKNKDLFDAAFEMVCWLLENGYIKKV